MTDTMMKLAELLENKVGNFAHTNDTDTWGVDFYSSTNGAPLVRTYVESRPNGGLFVWFADGSMKQITGTCQFSGKDSKSVLRWLRKNLII